MSGPSQALLRQNSEAKISQMGKKRRVKKEKKSLDDLLVDTSASELELSKRGKEVLQQKASKRRTNQEQNNQPTNPINGNNNNKSDENDGCDAAANGNSGDANDANDDQSGDAKSVNRSNPTATDQDKKKNDITMPLLKLQSQNGYLSNQPQSQDIEPKKKWRWKKLFIWQRWKKKEKGERPTKEHQNGKGDIGNGKKGTEEKEQKKKKNHKD
ncbi:hypothetical protein RFI_37559 [Reticulomyxa filosa]|uniref:Uncharacterized protein n=1 Tax=Reticulomyxa filosa TaxID=46433 RepID=X6LGT1_RETFI|nr:hypothetical protein RFI_37559 [Reticulomyxa filosa]|eukprot:ETN99909.1 hypothetical protein RFI_37559 [Reticulomyxa filosa]